jgi:hypothetical protein
MSRLWRTAVITTGACAVVAAGVGPAVAQSAKAGPTVSMSVKTLTPKVYGYTFVPFKDGKFSNVKFSGQVTGSTSGMVAQLYAQPFPYKKAAVPVPKQHLTLNGTSPESYTFTATPGIATRYRVEILPSATASTPVQATSSTATIYVVTNQPFYGLKNCGRPVCHQTIRIYTKLPASAYRTEAPKKLYFYFGLKLAPRVEPGPPAFLTLDRSARISKVKRISATEFEQTVTFSFRINNDGYRYLFNYCSKASEAKDGVNLPGHHHCGDTRVRASWFLG